MRRIDKYRRDIERENYINNFILNKKWKTRKQVIRCEFKLKVAKKEYLAFPL